MSNVSSQSQFTVHRSQTCLASGATTELGRSFSLISSAKIRYFSHIPNFFCRNIRFVQTFFKVDCFAPQNGYQKLTTSKIRRGKIHAKDVLRRHFFQKLQHCVSVSCMGEKGEVKVSKCQSVFLMFFKNACILKKHIIYIILFKRKKNTRKKK